MGADTKTLRQLVDEWQDPDEAVDILNRIGRCSDAMLLDAADALLSAQLPTQAAALAIVVLDEQGRSYAHTSPDYTTAPSLERHALAGAVAGLAKMLIDRIERHVLDQRGPR